MNMNIASRSDGDGQSDNFVLSPPGVYKIVADPGQQKAKEQDVQVMNDGRWFMRVEGFLEIDPEV
jgi:hypothetical protein